MWYLHTRGFLHHRKVKNCSVENTQKTRYTIVHVFYTYERTIYESCSKAYSSAATFHIGTKVARQFWSLLTAWNFVKTHSTENYEKRNEYDLERMAADVSGIEKCRYTTIYSISNKGVHLQTQNRPRAPKFQPLPGRKIIKIKQFCLMRGSRSSKHSGLLLAPFYYPGDRLFIGLPPKVFAELREFKNSLQRQRMTRLFVEEYLTKVSGPRVDCRID